MICDLKTLDQRVFYISRIPLERNLVVGVGRLGMDAVRTDRGAGRISEGLTL